MENVKQTSLVFTENEDGSLSSELITSSVEFNPNESAPDAVVLAMVNLYNQYILNLDIPIGEALQGMIRFESVEDFNAMINSQEDSDNE